ncbi:hypothetical protein LUZ60_015571 [Juncus effusus]|nr:hypothetical protein LUZ60_015571 [Juncus effusus]
MPRPRSQQVNNSLSPPMKKPNKLTTLSLPMKTKFLLTIAMAVAIASVSLSTIQRDKVGPTVVELREDDLEYISLEGAVGPESIVFDPNGDGPYTGISDGRILKWQGEAHQWMEYASTSPPELFDSCRGSKDPTREHICGRPLGLKLNEKTSDLYIADAYHGLLAVQSGGNITRKVTTEANGVPFHFTNSVEIDQETGVVYFTDSSSRFHRREFLSIVISGDRTGRLMKYNPKTNDTKILLDELPFPNGLVLSKDASFLLFIETSTCKVVKYWLKAPKTGTVEVIAELPGFPDNIKRSPRGGYWVAIHSKRTKVIKQALSFPWIRKQLLRLPLNVIQSGSLILSYLNGQIIAVRLTEEGEIVKILQGRRGMKLRHVSEVEELNGSLWVGSVVLPFLGVYRYQIFA